MIGNECNDGSKWHKSGPPLWFHPFRTFRWQKSANRKRIPSAFVTSPSSLAENIGQHGVLQPVLVHPLPGGEGGTYELVAGARRYRASKLAKRETIPAIVRELTDAQALELQVIENVQRVDAHPFDEGQGYAALIELQPDAYSVEVIAAESGDPQHT